MTFNSLDKIVRSYLLRSGLPIHWYMQCLKFSADALRELGFDSMQAVRTVKLTVNEYGSISLPCDYVDIIRIGSAYSDYLTPLAKRSNLNRLNNYDTSGAKIPYVVPSSDWSGLTSFFGTPYYAGWFGISGGTNDNSYKVLRERSEIQLSGFVGTDIILEYISDSSSADSATQVHPYAQAAIEAYIAWQIKQNNRSYSNTDKQLAQAEYSRQHKLLRARLNDMTLSDLRRTLANAYNASLP